MLRWAFSIWRHVGIDQHQRQARRRVSLFGSVRRWHPFAEGPNADTGTVVGKSTRTQSLSAANGWRAAPHHVGPPTVRALARKLDVDLSLVQPRGPDGTITRADVERAAKTSETGRPGRMRRSGFCNSSPAVKRQPASPVRHVVEIDLKRARQRMPFCHPGQHSVHICSRSIL